MEIQYLLIGFHSPSKHCRMLVKVCHQQSYLAMDPKYQSHRRKLHINTNTGYSYTEYCKHLH